MVFKGEQQVIPGTKPLPEGESVPGEKKRTRKKQPPKGSRWTIAILFLLTLLAIGAAFLKTSLPPLVQKITVPLVITSQKTEPQFDATSVLNQVKSLTQDLRGKYGLYVYELKSGNQYGVYQTEEFPAASLMKLPVMLLFYQEVEKGNLDPQGEYLLKEKDKVLGAGILPGKAAGTTYTYHYLVELMGQYSDNTAFKIMRQVLGDEQIQEMIDKLGMEKTSLQEFTTTPEDIGLFFQKLYQGEIINDEDRDELLQFLTKTAYEDWLPKGIPQGVKIAHKIGKDLGTFSDGGIIFADNPYIIVLMSKDARELEANEALPKISQIIWDYENTSSL